MSGGHAAWPQHLKIFFRDDAGAAAVEFALVFPLFLMTVFSTIYLSLAVGAYNNLQTATAQAARCLSVDVTGSCTVANINTFGQNLYDGPTIQGLTFTPSTASCGNQVVGSGTFTMFTGMGSVGVTLSATSCYPLT